MFGIFRKKKAVDCDAGHEKARTGTVWDSTLLPSEMNERTAAILYGLVQQNNKQANGLSGVAQDSADGNSPLKLNAQMPESMPASLALWYASNGFIGYQMCAILAQHWLIRKACNMPARDATRNGYELVSVDGTDIPESVIKKIKFYDKKFRLRWNCEQFVSLGRVFGIRIALFQIDSDEPDFYENPFNIDGVAKGAYKGISQIDPYWCIPELSDTSLTDPSGEHFYEPTYWRINGKRYHRSHLFIFHQDELPDFLKPAYQYGGLPVPQQIMERVYGAERTASEMLALTMSKRTTVWQTDMASFLANEEENAQKMAEWVRRRDNMGIKLGDREGDQFSQFDTSLSELSNIIMTQYQLVAAASGVPATKLLGTTPSGFNATGEYEERSYHEMLESIQEHCLTEFIERHHQLVMKSYCDEVVETTINWKPTDSPTAQQVAERNKLKADTDMVLMQTGAIDGEDVRYRVSTDPDSGYFDMGEKDSSDDVADDLAAIREELGLNDGDETERQQD